MEFFNSYKSISLSRIFKVNKNYIYVINLKKEIDKHGEYWVLRKLNKLYGMGVLFGIENFDGVGNLFLYSVLNTRPVFVKVATKSCDEISSFLLQSISLIEDFNIVVDIGGLNYSDMAKAFSIAKNRVVLSGAVLSGFVDKNALTFEMEELLVKKNTLFVIKIKNIKLDNNIEVVKRFINKFGFKNLAISIGNSNKRKIQKFCNLLKDSGISSCVLKSLMYENAVEFFREKCAMESFKIKVS